MTKFNVGDRVLMNDQNVVTITSWPAEDNGFFSWVRFDKKDNSETRGMGWYGETANGAPTTAADDLVLHVPASGPVESTADPIGDVTSEPDADAEPVVEEPAAAEVPPVDPEDPPADEAAE